MIHRLFYLLLILFINSNYAFGQFSIEGFFSEGWDISSANLKGMYPDKKIEEKEIMNSKAFSFYDWIKPVSIKVVYLFSSKGILKNKMISNSLRNEEAKEKLVDLLKQWLIKNYGKNFTENTFFGTKNLLWVVEGKMSITLSESGDKTVLTLSK